jgi:hypothetical protein
VLSDRNLGERLMRRAFTHAVVVAIAASVGCGTPNGGSDEASMDPAVVSPAEFKVDWDNERVRVLRVTVEDGAAPGPHSHPERVVVFLTPCTWLERTENGTVLEETNLAGEVLWMGPMVHEGGPNSVKDTCELLEIELK